MLHLISTMKWNEVLIHAKTGMNLANIMLSGKVRYKDPTLYESTYVNYPEWSEPQRKKVNPWWAGGVEVTTSGDEVFFWGDREALKLDPGSVCTSL